MVAYVEREGKQLKTEMTADEILLIKSLGEIDFDHRPAKVKAITYRIGLDDDNQIYKHVFIDVE